MSQENVEIVRRLNEAVNTRDFTAALDMYAEEAALVVHADPGPLLETTATGKEAVGKWFGDWYRELAHDYQVEIEEPATGATAYFSSRPTTGAVRSAGCRYHHRRAYVFTMREGKVWRVEIWADPEAALEAAGLSE